MTIPQKLKIDLPYGLPIPFVGTYTKELKARTQTDIWTPMFLSSIIDDSQKLEATQVG